MDSLAYYLGAPGTLPSIGPEKVRRAGKDRIARYSSPHGSHRYVMLDGERAIAVLQVVERGGQAVVANVYVLPEHRRRGLATALLARARRDFSVSHAPEHMLSDEGRAFRDADVLARQPNPVAPRPLPLSEIARWEHLMRCWGVSEVARSARGFLSAYKQAGGDLGAMSDAWQRRRAGFIARHMEQMKGESTFVDGLPSRRHLALVAWAYSPEPTRLARTRAPAESKCPVRPRAVLEVKHGDRERDDVSLRRVRWRCEARERRAPDARVPCWRPSPHPRRLLAAHVFCLRRDLRVARDKQQARRAAGKTATLRALPYPCALTTTTTLRA